MKNKVLAGIIFTGILGLIVLTGLAAAQKPNPLVDEVIAIVTAAAHGEDIDPMLDALAEKYQPVVVAKKAPTRVPTMTPTPTPTPVLVAEARLFEPVTIGDWLLYVYKIHRQPRVWYYDSPLEAENGVYALVRLKVNNLTMGVARISDQLIFEVRDEQGRIFEDLEGKRANRAAHRHVPNHADVRFKMPPAVIDYPVLLTFDVPADSEELWLDIYNQDRSEKASIYLSPCQSDEDRICEGKFIEADPKD